MGDFFKKIINKKLLILLTTILTLGSSAVVANAAFGCGGGGANTCGCQNGGNEAYNAGSCSVGVNCWYNTAGYGGCTGHDWYQTGSYYQYTTGSATCTTSQTIYHVYYDYYGCNRCSASRRDERVVPETVNPLEHDEGSYSDLGNGQHKAKCSRCGDNHTEGHAWGSDVTGNLNEWVETRSGYRYMRCIKSTTDTSGYHNLTDSDGCRIDKKDYYDLVLTFQTNGGTFLTGDKAGTTAVTDTYEYGNDVNLSNYVSTRPGYAFAGWGYYYNGEGVVIDSTETTSNKYNTPFGTTGKVKAQSINSALASGDCRATLFAQWTKTIQYNIGYLNSEGESKTDTFWIVFQNHATDASVTHYTPSTDGNNDGDYNDSVDNKAIYYTDSTLTKLFNSGIKTIASYKDGSKITNQITGSTPESYSDWVERGIAKENKDSWATTINDSLYSSIGEVLSPSGTINYYASYERTPTITLVDYGTNEKIIKTINGTVNKGDVDYITAGLQYNGVVDRTPVFTFPKLDPMVFAEETAHAGIDKNEPWSACGWSNANADGYNPTARTYNNGIVAMGTANVSSETRTSVMASYGTYTYHGNYTKTPRTTYDANGGKIENSPYKTITSTPRYAIILETQTKPKTLTFKHDSPNAYYTDSNNEQTIYTQQHYSWATPDSTNNYWINQDPLTGNARLTNKTTGYYSKNKTIWEYTPLVTETIYAKWTNETKEASVLKQAVWKTINSDTYDPTFDKDKNNLANGEAEVTLTITLNSASTVYTAEDLYVEDYINIEMWDWISGNTNTGSISKTNDGTVKWSVGDVVVDKNTTITATYLVRLKEEYWTKDADGNLIIEVPTNYYINPMNGKNTYAKSVQAYLDSLEGTINSDGTYDETKVSLNRDNMYYKESLNSHRSYIYINYHYGTTDLDGTQRYVAYPVDYVRMQFINWEPDAQGDISISSDTNNIYQNIDAKDPNTYFVQYDTHSTNDSRNSRFTLKMKSQITRSYLYYQITDNIFDFSTKTGDIDNYLAVDNTNANLVFNASQLIADSKKQSGSIYRTDNSMLQVYSAFNKRSEVAKALKDGRTAYYLNSALSSEDVVYATNQDGLNFDIVPTMVVTNTRNGKTQQFSDTVDKINLTIDATNPIITPDKLIKTSSEKYGEWTESDGYIDINLVNGNTDPIPQTHYLTFKFEDKVSGINHPKASTKDWIDTINENVQVTLVNTDSGKVLFDYNKDTYGSFLKVVYDNTNKMNKTGSVTLTLDPTNDDFLGHLQLTIKVIDNVSNWETKTYDIYSFCLTGEVNVVDTLPNADEHLPAEIYNGEQGKVSIEASGYVDRVAVNFENSLVQATKDDVSQRNDITGDDYKINGDYPVDNSNLTKDKTEVKYLPKRYLKCRWGYTNSTLGGLPLTSAELSTIAPTIDNKVLIEHLNELIENFQLLHSYGIPEDVDGSDYAIRETTLYSYPVYNNGKIKSYAHSYELDGMTEIDGVSYPVNVIIDGRYSATINYTRIYKTNQDTGEVEEYLVPMVENQTTYSSEWVQSGNAYLRPLTHYFFMPRNAEPRTAENGKHYLVELTAYKDSEKDFKHEVSIQLKFNNNSTGEPPRELQTNIKDN